MNSLHRVICCVLASSLAATCAPAFAQSSDHQEVEQLKQLVLNLEARVSALEQQNAALRGAPVRGADGQEVAAALVKAAAALRGQPSNALSAAPVPPQSAVQTAGEAGLPAHLPGGATLNYMLDGYYEYNFNQPVGRANNLRAYDVLSNSFSLSQADVILDLQPDLPAHRRYGARLDLQFGQSTGTALGNPANEPRPEFYRNIFQAYGTYVLPVGNGVNLDFGKWASTLGVEGTYTKDQMNYTRSMLYTYLPLFHTGLRTQYHLNDKLALNYWLVDGASRSEPVNGFKDELFGYNWQPSKSLSWTLNYYLGQEHPDVTPASNCSVPLQPSLCVVPITPAPNGKLHIFDTYATWQATPKFTLQGEADYSIQREWANAAPGESSAPSHLMGAAGYLQYQLTARSDVSVRGEYLSDRGGLFSGATQALKEGTATWEYKVSDNFEGFFEFRHDWSNVNYFTTDRVDSLKKQQPTAAVGLVWWYGGKQGTW